jgi:pimeloyl-ACP methyl ester carboxylesterase
MPAEPSGDNRRNEVEPGGRSLATTVLGEGEPFVLLEVGLGADSHSWSAVADGVARFTRVGYYDRAGRGGSDPAPTPRDANSIVEDAHRVLRALAPSSRVIYVGQSFGGLMARLYAHRHPAQVAALVLVDAMHVDQFEACAPHFPPAVEGEPATLTSMRDFWSGGWRDPSQNKEGIDMLSCRSAARRAASLGDLPIRVLTAGTFTNPPQFPDEQGEKLQAIWEGLQDSFVRLSSQSSRQQVPESGHFMQNDKPEVVIETIAELVECVRRASS